MRRSRDEAERGKEGICDPTRSPAMKATVRDGSMSLPHWRAITLTQVSLDDVDKTIRHFTNLVIGLTLNHHPQERLGSGVTHQHAPTAIERLLTFLDRALELRDC